VIPPGVLSGACRLRVAAPGHVEREIELTDEVLDRGELAVALERD